MHGLEAVAHIGQRTRHDYRHGVIAVGVFHFLLNIDFDYSVFVNHFLLKRF